MAQFDVAGEGFPSAPPPAGRVLPFRCSLRSAPGGHPPAVGLGRAVSASRVRFARPRNPRQPSPCGLCVAPGCSGRPLTLPHPSKRAYGPLRASWIRSRPSGATGHRIALGGPLRPPDGHSGPAWSSPAPQAWFRGSAPAPSPFGFDALADGSIEPLPSVWPSRWAAAIAAFLASAVTPRTDHGAGRGPFLAILGID